MTEPVISKWLATLEATQLIRAIAGSPDLEYLFRHGLIQSAAYDSLLRIQQRAIHKSVGETLERMYPERQGEIAATLAYHFSQAAMPEKAFHYLLLVAKQAQKAYANTEALAHYRSAITELLQLLNQSKGWAQDAVPTYEGQGDVLFRLGQRDEARESYETALSYAPSFERVLQARIQRKIAATVKDNGDKMRRYEAAQTLLGEPSGTSSDLWWEEWIELQLRYAMRYYFANQIGELEAILRRIEPHVEQHGTLPQRASFSSTVTLMMYRKDRLVISDETLNSAHRTLELSEAIHDPAKVADAKSDLGFCYLFYPDLEKARQYLGEALDFGTRTGSVGMQVQALTHLTTAYRFMGDVHRVEECARRALDIASRVGIFYYEAAARANLSWLAWRANDLVTAKQEGQAALDQWVEKDSTVGYPWQWLARLHLMAMALDEGAQDQAVEQARAMLHTGQQRLPEPLNDALEQGLTEPAALAKAVDAAGMLGYL